MKEPSIYTLMQKEANFETKNLSQKSTLEILEIINKNDQIVAKAISEILPTVANVVEAMATRIKNGGRIFYVGAGTSGRLAVLDSAECPPTFGTNPELIQSIIAGGKNAILHAVEDVEDSETEAIEALKERNISEADIIIGISASGRTPFALSALKFGNELGCLTIALCTRGHCAMEKEADMSVIVDVGSEVLTGSSRMKSGTAQKMLLGMMSTTLMTRLGKVHNNLMIDLIANNEKLKTRAESIVANVCDISYDEAAEYLKQAENKPRIAILMRMAGLTYDQALACIDSEFQSLDDQLANAKRKFN